MPTDNGDPPPFSYTGKLILAPMVRVGTLPTRLLALEFGADLVYSEELIDYRLLKSRRIPNPILGSIDYVDADNQIIYRTCPLERGRNILQIGTCSPERAVRVAQLVRQDVAGIDVNMGCPKEFSLKGNMGAALLSQPDLIERIMRSLVEAAPDLLITCKVRVFDDVDKTVELCRRIESTGIRAIGVHGRTREERPQHRNRNSTIRRVAESLRIPVIANGGSGDVKCYGDIETFRKDCGAAAVMLARQAESNVSIFRKEGLLPRQEVIKRLLRLSIEWDNRFPNVKYCVQQILGSEQDTTEEGRRFLATRCIEDVCDIFGLREFYDETQRRFATLRLKEEAKESKGESDDPAGRLGGLKRKLDVTELETKFCRNLFDVSDLPKTILLNKSRRDGEDQPVYKIVNVDRAFRAVVEYGGKKYSSSFCEKNKRMAEQGAALVCLYSLGVLGEDKVRGESKAKVMKSEGD